jgi:glycolate oxidase iron-sulfur subunit
MHADLDKDLRETELGEQLQALLRQCVHCGFCLPACPTYRIAGNELDSPRGRIYLIKQAAEGEPTGRATREHLDRCLTCRACETACPSGVQYGRLIDIGRELTEAKAPRPPGQRLLRWVMTESLSRKNAFGTALGIGRTIGPLLPVSLREKLPPAASPGAWPEPRHKRKMIVLDGCVQPALRPQINAAAARLLDRLGISLVPARGETCCGALSHHLGRTAKAREQAKQNIDACLALMDKGAEAIVSTTSACGLMFKDYARLLANEPLWVEKATRVADASRDLCEVLEPEDLRRIAAPGREPGPIAWQAPCTLQHGQKLTDRVEPLLLAVGCILTPVAESTLCCGSAGTYSLLQAEMSAQLKSRKLERLLAGKPNAIATGNIGCLEHLRPDSPVPVRHWVELVDEACHY